METKGNGSVQEKEAGIDVVKPSGHLDQLFRQTRAYHAQLSQMADVKASMMLTLASLITTFSIRYLEDPYLRWPVVIMLCFCLITIVAAAYAVMPKLKISVRPDIKSPHSNLLFFGVFASLEYEEWVAEMKPLLQDPTRAYEAMLREIYEMGIYLERKKYRFIRIAYTSFLTGLVLSTLALVVVEIANLVGRAG